MGTGDEVERRTRCCRARWVILKLLAVIGTLYTVDRRWIRILYDTTTVLQEYSSVSLTNGNTWRGVRLHPRFPGIVSPVTLGYQGYEHSCHEYHFAPNVKIHRQGDKALVAHNVGA